MLKSGFKKVTVHNAKELEVLLMNNATYVAELAHNLSARKKAQLVTRANELNIRLTAVKAKNKVVEKK